MGQEEEEEFLVGKVTGGKKIFSKSLNDLKACPETGCLFSKQREPRWPAQSHYQTDWRGDTLQGLILNKCHWPPDSSSAFGLFQQTSKTIQIKHVRNKAGDLRCSCCAITLSQVQPVPAPAPANVPLPARGQLGCVGCRPPCPTQPWGCCQLQGRGTTISTADATGASHYPSLHPLDLP